MFGGEFRSAGLFKAPLLGLHDRQLAIRDLVGLQDVAGFEEDLLMQNALPGKVFSRQRH